MPSTLYNKTMALITEYIGAEKAAGVVDRQVEHCGATADNFGKEHFDKVLPRLKAASTMWLGDVRKKDELTARLLTLA